MARLVVTGGTGFIGSNLALALEQGGHEVIVLDRTLHQAGNLAGFRGRILEIDVSGPFSVDGEVDAIFHQAAITDPRHGNDEETYQRNLAGFHRVAELARIKQARLIYASTAGLYGNGPVPMREDQPKECLTAYGRSKLKMDEMAATLEWDNPIVGLRYFNVFGPGEAHKGRPSSMILHLATQMKAGHRPRIFRAGEHRRDHIYVKDVVEANLAALTAPSGIYNVGTGVGTTFNELVALLNRSLGTSLEPEYFEMPYDPKTYQHHTVADTRLARERLGFTARWNLADAISDYLAWMQRQ